MLDKISNDSDMVASIGENLYGLWQNLAIQSNAEYAMDYIWNIVDKKWGAQIPMRRKNTLHLIHQRKPDWIYAYLWKR